MKVLHSIPSLSPKHGGPSFALPLFARALAQRGVEVAIATTDDDGPGGHLAVPLNEFVAGPGTANTIYFRKNTEFYKGSWGFARWMGRHVGDYDLLHIHALFSFTSAAAGGAARRAGVPYVVRPLGVLNRWGIENRRRFLKQSSLRMIEMPLLRGAAAIHYTAAAERSEAAVAHPDIAALPSAIIPIPVESGIGDAVGFYARFPATAGRPIILFLSRIDPKKGIELLLAAFQRIREEFKDALLVIAGDGAQNYVETLRRRAQELGCDAAVLWTGFLAGEEKAGLLAAASIFVLPSFSENFGIAAAEALAAGIPSVLTGEVAIATDARAADAALVVPCEIDALAEAMRALLKDAALRTRLSSNARQMVKEQFSPEAVGGQLAELYRKVIQEGKVRCST